MAKKMKQEDMNYSFDLFAEEPEVILTASTPKTKVTKSVKTEEKLKNSRVKTKKVPEQSGEILKKDALELARDNYREYGIYVGSGRAYPGLLDGAKSSYKRAIYGMWKDSPRSIVKVAELAAAALPYHPHPTSISGVIVQLGENGNKFKFMKTQGNWGDSSKGIQASADRYIGGMLSDLSLELLCDGMVKFYHCRTALSISVSLYAPACDCRENSFLRAASVL